MTTERKLIPVKLDGGGTIYVEATVHSDDPEAHRTGPVEEDISILIPSFDEINFVLEAVSRNIMGTLEKVKPTKASVEFGVDMGVEAGKLTTLLVKGAGSANLKIKLEWDAEVQAKLAE